MTMNLPDTVLVVADDDEDDRLLLREALDRCGFPGRVLAFPDGEGLLHYLGRLGEEIEKGPVARPHVVLLDLNMPRVDGYQVLEEMKSDPALRSIPVVVLTTSDTEEDVVKAYDLGVNTYLTKPSSYDGFIELVSTLKRYWLEMARLP